MSVMNHVLSLLHLSVVVLYLQGLGTKEWREVSQMTQQTFLAILPVCLLSVLIDSNTLKQVLCG